MRLARIGRRLRTLAHAVIANDGGDAQPIISKDAATAGRLGGAMLRLVAPGFYCLLVAPNRERKKLFCIGQALKALDRNETVTCLELFPQRTCKAQVVVLAAFCRPHFEYDCDHLWLRRCETMF